MYKCFNVVCLSVRPSCYTFNPFKSSVLLLLYGRKSTCAHLSMSVHSYVCPFCFFSTLFINNMRLYFVCLSVCATLRHISISHAAVLTKVIQNFFFAHTLFVHATVKFIYFDFFLFSYNFLFFQFVLMLLFVDCYCCKFKCICIN